MGSQESKLEATRESPTDLVQTIPESISSTPILTSLDPRSPSVNIARTPLGLLLDRESRKEFYNCDASIHGRRWNDESETTNVILGIDPRSPTIEFTRTPIVGAVAKENKFENKNHTSVLRSGIQTPSTARTRQSRSIPPRLIGSKVLNPLSATLMPAANKRNFVGLLETNLDYTETNLDIAQNNTNISLPLVLNEASPISNKLKKQAEVLSKNHITYLDKIDNDETNFQAENTINVTKKHRNFDKKLKR